MRHRNREPYNVFFCVYTELNSTSALEEKLNHGFRVVPKKVQQPYVASLRATRGKHLCSVTIFHVYIVLSTADCVIQYKDQEQYQTKIYVAFMSDTHFIEYLETHPNYSDDNINYNIGVIQVSCL